MMAVTWAFTRRPILGRKSYQKTSWSRRGVPRMSQMNGAGIHRTHQIFERRITATSSASGKAPIRAITAISRAIRSPRHRNGNVT